MSDASQADTEELVARKKRRIWEEELEGRLRIKIDSSNWQQKWGNIAQLIAAAASFTTCIVAVYAASVFSNEHQLRIAREDLAKINIERRQLDAELANRRAELLALTASTREQHVAAWQYACHQIAARLTSTSVIPQISSYIVRNTQGWQQMQFRGLSVFDASHASSLSHSFAPEFKSRFDDFVDNYIKRNAEILNQNYVLSWNENGQASRVDEKVIAELKFLFSKFSTECEAAFPEIPYSR